MIEIFSGDILIAMQINWIRYDGLERDSSAFVRMSKVFRQACATAAALFIELNLTFEMR